MFTTLKLKLVVAALVVAAAAAGAGPLVMNDGVPLAGFEKFLLTDAAKTGAVCLDGSPGGGYIRRGDPKKWIIFHQGGTCSPHRPFVVQWGEKSTWCAWSPLCRRHA